jgi:hypothetical protein
MASAARWRYGLRLGHQSASIAVFLPIEVVPIIVDVAGVKSDGRETWVDRNERW